ncbi:hypothetical protein C2S52_000620 [Perilla frutescens var. hirtella]|nr:hypothetical protein C2S52_000620 [Perilla frutescens var. hirtella]
MLMGLGGLYSAANLISTSDPKAIANPIPPPDFKRCGLSHVSSRDGSDMMDVMCCPPISDSIKPYVLPEVVSMRVRKPAHTLDRDSIAQYEEAIRRMRELDETDPRGFIQQAKVHCTYCNGAYPEPGSDVKISVHYSWLFFPFHRCRHADAALLQQQILPPLRCRARQAPCPPAIVNLEIGPDSGTHDRQKIANNLSIMHNEMIGGVNSTTDFMGAALQGWRPHSPLCNGGTVERGSHYGVTTTKWVNSNKTLAATLH